MDLLGDPVRPPAWLSAILLACCTTPALECRCPAIASRASAVSPLPIVSMGNSAANASCQHLVITGNRMSRVPKQRGGMLARLFLRVDGM